MWRSSFDGINFQKSVNVILCDMMFLSDLLPRGAAGDKTICKEKRASLHNSAIRKAEREVFLVDLKTILFTRYTFFFFFTACYNRRSGRGFLDKLKALRAP